MSFEQRQRWRRGALGCGAVAVLALSGAGTAVAASGRFAIPGSHPAWADSAHQSASPPTPGTIDIRVYLAGQNDGGLATYAQAVSDPSNALYGDYLTPGQVQAQFAPTGAESQAVQSWLQGEGLTISDSTTGIGAYVEASGSLQTVGNAFGVSFANYVDPTGATARAPESAATVPSGVAGDISAVAGLDSAQFTIRPEAKLPPPPPNYWVAPPTSSYYGQKIATHKPTAYGAHQPWTNAGYTPQQLRGAYGVTGSGMTGAGQTVAVVDAYASPTMQQDANEFSQVTGNQQFRSGQYQQYLAGHWDDVKPTECDAAGWYSEETLDVEAVHGLAPDANVSYVGAQDCTDQGFTNALAFIVNTRLATIVTDSWGGPTDTESIAPVYDQIFEAGTAEGIGFFFSSGDNGYDEPTIEDPGISDQIQVEYPTSSPWVTSVGGTSLAIGSSNNYEWETDWGTVIDPLATTGTSWLFSPPGDYATGYDGSSGGGVSTVYTQPSYQRGVVPRSLATDVPEGSTHTPMRVVPDISTLADSSTGILLGETTLQPNGKTYAFSLSRLGGTSVSSPTFAGIEADAQQAAGHDLGFANPVIYARYGSQAFHDVTDDPFGPGVTLAEVRNNYTDPSTAQGPLLTYLRTLGIDGEGAATLTAGKGYDDSTGVGSPNQYVQSFGGF